MSIKGSLTKVLAGAAVVVASATAADVSAQSSEDNWVPGKRTTELVNSIEENEEATARLREGNARLSEEIDRLSEETKERIANTESAQFYLDHGYNEEVKKNVKVNFASHFPSGKPITQSMYEVGASVAKKSSAPQVVILVVRDPNETLSVKSGNRSSNTEYEQKVINMATNVSNSFEDPQAKVMLALAVAQEDGINTSPGDILFYINDRVRHHSPTSEDNKDLDEDDFIRNVAYHLGYQFSSGGYKLDQDQVLEILEAKRKARDDLAAGGSSSGGGAADDTVAHPQNFADNGL